MAEPRYKARISASDAVYTGEIDAPKFQDGVIVKVSADEESRNCFLEWKRDGESRLGTLECGPFTMDEAIRALGRLPQAGDRARFYGGGFGSPILGAAINHIVIFYQTEDEYSLELAVRGIVREGFNQHHFQNRWAEIEARIAKLPIAFRLKLERIMDNRPDRAHRTIPMELWCCEQAVLLASTLRNDGAIRSWAQQSETEQAEDAVPGWDYLGHTHHSHNYTVMLARLYLIDPSEVPESHAYFAILSGCEEAGCHKAGDFTGEEKA